MTNEVREMMFERTITITTPANAWGATTLMNAVQLTSILNAMVPDGQVAELKNLTFKVGFTCFRTAETLAEIRTNLASVGLLVLVGDASFSSSAFGTATVNIEVDELAALICTADSVDYVAHTTLADVPLMPICLGQRTDGADDLFSLESASIAGSYTPKQNLRELHMSSEHRALDIFPFLTFILYGRCGITAGKIIKCIVNVQLTVDIGRSPMSLSRLNP